MNENPTRLKIWWSASVAFAFVFIGLAFIAPIGTALIVAAATYGLALFGGYRMRRRT